MTLTATGSRISIARIAEVTYGTTPATPAFTTTRFVSSSLGINKGNFESGEVRSDRQIAHLRHGIKSVGGDLGIELSYSTFDDLIEALAGGTWSGDQLKAGTTRRSFTFERKYENIAVPEWHRFTGCEINSLSLSIQPEGMVTGTFGIMAQDGSIGTAIISGATYGAAPTTEPMDTFTGSINEGGGSIGTATSLELQFENGIGNSPAIGSDVTLQPAIGKSRVTGTLTTYFQSKTLFEKFLNETSSSITVTLTDPAGNDYIIDFSNIKYTGAPPEVSGEGEVTIAMPFTALYDVTDVSNFIITRVPA